MNALGRRKFEENEKKGKYLIRGELMELEIICIKEINEEIGKKEMNSDRNITVNVKRY